LIKFTLTYSRQLPLLSFPHRTPLATSPTDYRSPITVLA
jgi:hypothetical protein